MGIKIGALCFLVSFCRQTSSCHSTMPPLTSPDRPHLCLTAFLAIVVVLAFIWSVQDDATRYVLIAPRDTDIGNDADPVHCYWFPVDPNNELASLFKTNVSLACPYIEPMTRLHPRTGKVVLNFSRVYGLDYTCWYQFFHRHLKDENENRYEEWQSFPPLGVVQMTLEKNFMKVTCSNFWGLTVYINTHVFIPTFPSEHISSPGKPSVVMFVVESLSQHAFKRLMPKTQQLMEGMGGQYFDYFVKTHDNSFPNTFALLTGQPDYPRSEQEYANMNLDDMEYLWDVFKKAGYTTGYIEDLANYGMFNYYGQGFHEEPTDFYPHAFWNEMYPSWTDLNFIDNHMVFDRDFCFATNGPKINILMDQVTRFVEINHQHPFFLFVVAWQLTHEYLNYVTLLDDPISDTLSKLQQLDNNTMIMLAGDHGFRRGFSVSNSVGRLEERMSLMSVIVPDAVHTAFPHIRQMMTANQHHLVSYRDFNLMMKNIASGEFQTDPAAIAAPQTEVATDATFPIDPSRHVVPNDRSCGDVGIEERYCVCGNYVSIDLNAKTGSFLDKWIGLNVDVQTIDYLVKLYVRRECDPSFVAKSAQYLLPTGNVSILNEHVIVHLTNPGGESIRLNLYRNWESGSPTRWLLSRNAKCQA